MPRPSGAKRAITNKRMIYKILIALAVVTLLVIAYDICEFHALMTRFNNGTVYSQHPPGFLHAQTYTPFRE